MIKYYQFTHISYNSWWIGRLIYNYYAVVFKGEMLVALRTIRYTNLEQLESSAPALLLVVQEHSELFVIADGAPEEHGFFVRRRSYTLQAITQQIDAYPRRMPLWIYGPAQCQAMSHFCQKHIQPKRVGHFRFLYSTNDDISRSFPDAFDVIREVVGILQKDRDGHGLDAVAAQKDHWQ